MRPVPKDDKVVLYPADAPAAGGHYSPGLQVGNLVFVSGQGGFDSATGELPDGIEAQTQQTLANIEAVLAAGGATRADVVKVTAHLARMELFDRYDTMYGSFFPEPRPVRTTVGSELAEGLLVEIDVIARLPDQRAK